MEKHVFKDFHKNILEIDDEVIFVDRTTGQFQMGNIDCFRRYAVGIVGSSSKGKVTYWRSAKEVIKTCQP